MANGERESLDGGGFDDRSLLNGQTISLEMVLHGFIALRAYSLLVQQMPKPQDRVLLRDPIGAQGDADKAARHCQIDQGIRHCPIAENEPLLQ